jgi:hypothetical protein
MDPSAGCKEQMRRLEMTQEHFFRAVGGYNMTDDRSTEYILEKWE